MWQISMLRAGFPTKFQGMNQYTEEKLENHLQIICSPFPGNAVSKERVNYSHILSREFLAKPV